VQGKKILLGITGSIAAYKSAALVRVLVKSGAEVKVIMTRSAHDFITPLTLATVSRQPVLTEFTEGNTGVWNNHVELGLWADLMVIAPASANTLAKMANGTCDNLLLATYLSARCPVAISPAMDLDMLQHPATQRNLQTLSKDGVHIIEPRFGELASGLVGVGRMAEPEEIHAALHEILEQTTSLAGKSVLLTAGPTQEAIDPVRYITNHSTGKMGYAIAEELAQAGARVHVVSGPTTLQAQHPGISVERVNSADEMWHACESRFAAADITVLSAAVADYKPVAPATQKLKKTDAALTLSLTKTVDIAAELGKRKQPAQMIVGFALETENEEANAIEKLERKNFDLIVLNSLRDAGAGFGGDTNRIKLINRKKQIQSFDLKSKREVARDVVQAIIDLTHG
jgi:phosphopantothenoylcysteine decarboxylase/phosphopantothenate--cysteine ligase